LHGWNILALNDRWSEENCFFNKNRSSRALAYAVFITHYMPMSTFKNIYKLLASDNFSNVALAQQILKGNMDLKQQVQSYFKPILDASKKKTVEAIPALLQELKGGGGSIEAKLAIGTIPELYDEFKGLFLRNATIRVLPNWIQELSELQILVVEDCQLTTVPDWIGALSKLTFLLLRNNQIDSIPTGIGALHCLEQLFVSNNKIHQLPDSLADLPRLKVISVKKNNPIDQVEIERLNELLPNVSIQ